MSVTFFLINNVYHLSKHKFYQCASIIFCINLNHVDTPVFCIVNFYSVSYIFLSNANLMNVTDIFCICVGEVFGDIFHVCIRKNIGHIFHVCIRKDIGDIFHVRLRKDIGDIFYICIRKDVSDIFSILY